MPSRSSCAVICGPPPCTTTGRSPAYRRNTTSSANASCSAGSVIALPPYFTTTSGRGSAPARAAPRRGRWPSSSAACACGCSCRVRRVLVHVGGGEVVGPDRRLGVAGVEVDGDGDLAGRRGRPWPRSSAAAPSRQTQTPLSATSRCSGSNAASVVPTAARTRPQLGSSPWRAHLSRLLRATARADRRPRRRSWPRATTSTAMFLVDALGVGDQLPGQVGADRRRPRRAAASSPGVDPGRAAGQQQHGVVGGHAAVGVDPVERRARSPRRSAASSAAGVGDRVGGEDDEHGGQPGREHAGALGHPADQEAAGADGDRLLGHRVGGHDRPGRVVGRRHGEQRHGRVDAGEQRGPSAAARRSGRSSRPRRRRPTTPSAIADALGGGVGVLEAGRPGAGVGAAGVEDDGVDPAVRAAPAALQSTGAALTRLPVKTPAAACVRAVVDDQRDVERPLDLSPAATPAARNPAAR